MSGSISGRTRNAYTRAAAQQADNLDAPRAWTLVAAVAIGYMVSRGLAKNGSAHRMLQ